MAAAADALTMKLLVESRPPRRRVVFAEAGKDAVDFLFSLLAMPAGTATKLLGKESMVGSVGNLYASVEALVQDGPVKDALLCPASSLKSSLFRLPAPAPPPSATTTKSTFMCPNSRYASLSSYASCLNYVAEARGAQCPNCRSEMTEAKSYVAPQPGAGAGQEQDAASAKKGFVKDSVTYMVADDLTVTPMSTISSITWLSAVAVREGLGALQEKTVQLGYKEGLGILRASLQSKTVLTDVFLGNKPQPQPPPSNNGAALFNNGRRYESLTWRV